MSVNWTKLRTETPRAFEVVDRDIRKERDPGRKRVSKQEVARRLEPMMGLMASGDIPMDKHSAEAIAAYIDSRGSHG